METTIASIAALAIAALAAVADWRTTEIANWITLPPTAISPFLYAFFLGADYGLLSVASLFLCAFVPYGLFRQGAMGGGDVKLFAALGAVTGFDIRAGIEIQLAAFIVAMVVAFGVLAWKGVLIQTFWNVVRLSFRRLCSSSLRRQTDIEMLTPIRMGGAIFIGTALVALPYLNLRWVVV
jgi:prepilin peptidase CpaA